MLADALQDPLVVGRLDLGSVAPEDLVAVVLFGVVRGRDHDADGRAFLLYGEWHEGRGRDGREEVNPKACFEKNASRKLSPTGREVSRVKTDDSAGLFQLLKNNCKLIKIKDKNGLGIIPREFRKRGHTEQALGSSG